MWAMVRTWALSLSEVAAMGGFEQKRDMGGLRDSLLGTRAEAGRPQEATAMV